KWAMQADVERTAERVAERVALSKTGFPSGFLWGMATAAYQIEGAARIWGKGESVWDRFTQTPGAILDGTTGETACDHHARWREDLNLLADLHANAYRCSVAWTRLFPTGRGKLNPLGMDFYEQLVDGLLTRNIAPFVTLYHWDLPQALQDRGGWANRDTAAYFADYVYAVASRLGDRVAGWVTLNEPYYVVYDGYVSGTKAPGVRRPDLAGTTAHHLLLAHGLGAQALRATSGAPVGIALNVAAVEPASDREADLRAAATYDGLWHRWFLDPLFLGRYPADVAPLVALPETVAQAGDLERIAAPLDFLGVNYYTRAVVAAGRQGPSHPVVVKPRGERTSMGWEVYPQGLREVLERLHREYAPPALYVTENGAAYRDHVTAKGTVLDPERVGYLRRHFVAAREALATGVPLRGYFVWSLLDNFEWSYGYTQRFGLAYTDFTTQQRTVKQSGTFFARVAATNGGALEA
ncbi:MAG: GH1 family beta-glucosidase, partial [Ktedonobacterales bacterium]